MLTAVGAFAEAFVNPLVPALMLALALRLSRRPGAVRLVGPRPGYTYYVWSVPKGYAVPDAFGEVELKTPLGTDKVEHVFKLTKK